LVPQELALLEDMNAYDNLMFFGALYGLTGKLLKERIQEALEVTGLADRKKEKVKKFSGGMKRRLNIAAALMHHPKILIMDEPTVGVDPQSRNHIFEFTKRIAKERKTTVIYTSHYMEEIEELCSKVFIIDLGREIAYGTKDHIKSLSGESTKITFEIKGLTAQLVYNLKQLPQVTSILDINDVVTLVVDKSFKLTNAIKVIEDSHCLLTKISYEEPRLEDVFLSLTGKTLRD
ncbi:MAG: ABC transporter ATP-binding protein, partial [Turicibacter sp.]